jgi:putative addiction module component (TIGR02574 family)
MSERDRIVEAALKLAVEDRAFVADAIEQSLPDSGEFAGDVAAAWSKEIDRRIEAYEAGRTKSFSAEDSIRRARQILSEQGAQA